MMITRLTVHHPYVSHLGWAADARIAQAKFSPPGNHQHHPRRVTTSAPFQGDKESCVPDCARDRGRRQWLR
jgi:hypothetical protein